MKVWSQEGFVFQPDTIKNSEENLKEGKLNLHCCLSSPSTSILHILSTMLNPGSTPNTFQVKDNFFRSASIFARIQRDRLNNL